MLQALFLFECAAIEPWFFAVWRSAAIIIVYSEVALDGDAVYTRVINRRVVGQCSYSNAEADFIIHVVRPDAVQVKRLITVIALAMRPGDHARPGRSPKALRPVA